MGLDATTTASLLTLAGVTLGALPGTVVPLVNARAQRKMDEAESQRLAEAARVASRREFLEAFDAALAAAWFAHDRGSHSRTDSDLVVAARQAASWLMLEASEAEKKLLDMVVHDIHAAVFDSPPLLQYLEGIRKELIAAFRVELGRDLGGHIHEPDPKPNAST